MYRHPGGHAWRPRVSARWLAAALVFAGSLWLSVPQRTALGIDPTGSAVDTVPVGSHEWIAGVRPGHAYLHWPDFAGSEVQVTGLPVVIPDEWPAVDPARLLLPLVLLALVFAVSRVAPSMVSAVCFAAVAALEATMLGSIAMPMAVVVMILPAALASAVVPLAPTWLRRSLWVYLGVIASVIVIGALMSPPWLSWASLWTWSWAAPTSVVVTCLATAAVIPVARAVIDREGDGTIGPALLAQTMIGRRALRVADEHSRDRNAQLLHDRVLPRLAAGMRSASGGDLAGTQRLLGDLMSDLRRTLGRDQLVILRVGGLQRALEASAAAVRAQGIDCVCEVAIDGDRPPITIEIAALRIAQEALDNAVEHASADQIRVRAVVGAKSLRVEVIDDGVGLEALPSRASTGEGLGLASMAERAGEVGGRLALDANSPRGLRVSFWWPA